METGSLLDPSQFDKIAFIDEKYNLVKKIGKGATATVYLGYDKSKENEKAVEMYAFKVLKIKKNSNDPLDSDLYTSFTHEVEILSILSNGLQNKFTYYYESSSSSILKKANGKKHDISYIKIQYLPNGELFDYVFYPKKGFGENLSRLIFKSILDELQVIHDINYIHRDLKTENIMLDCNYDVKICDYGFANENKSKITSFCGTTGYIAPELLMKQPYNGIANDIFSLGVILFVLVTGTMPFRSATSKDQFYNLIWRGDYDKFWKYCQCKLSENFKHLINNMICFCPEERLSISEILSSPWMREGDFGVNNYKVLKEELAKRKKSIKRRKNSK